MAIQSGGPWQSQAGGVIGRAQRIQASAKRPIKNTSTVARDIGKGPVGNSLLAQAQQLANLQTQGPLADLAQQLAASNRQTQGTMKLAGGYYNQLGQQAQQGVTDEQGIANALNTQLQGIAGNTNTQLQGIGQNATNSLLAHAPQGEGGLSTAALGSLASEIARQQGLAAQQQGSQQAFGATQGANYAGLAGTGLSSNALAGTQALKGIAQSGTVRNQPLSQKIADLQAQKGALVATDLGKLQQQATNNMIAEQGLGIKQDAITSANLRSQNAIAGQNQRNRNTITGQNQRSRNTITAQNQRSQDTITAANRRDQLDRQSRESIAAANRAAKTGTGGSKPLTTHENNAVLTSLDKIQNAITTWQQEGFKDKTGKVTEPHPTNAQMRQILGGGGYPAYLVQAAFELLGWGHITGGTAAALHQRGIRGGTFRGRPIKVGPPPSGAQQVATKVGSGVQGVANAVGGVFGQ